MSRFEKIVGVLLGISILINVVWTYERRKAQSSERESSAGESTDKSSERPKSAKDDSSCEDKQKQVRPGCHCPRQETNPNGIGDSIKADLLEEQHRACEIQAAKEEFARQNRETPPQAGDLEQQERKLCRLGDAASCKKVYHRAQEECDQQKQTGGKLWQCLNVAYMDIYGQSGLPGNPSLGYSRMEELCQSKKEPYACEWLGNRYLEGDEENQINVDPAKSLRLYQESCDSGGPCGSLAEFYEKGEHVPLDKSYALTLYHKSCQAGDRSSCLEEGRLYKEGYGNREAQAQFETEMLKSCQQRDSVACRWVVEKYAGSTSP